LGVGKPPSPQRGNWSWELGVGSWELGSPLAPKGGIGVGSWELGVRSWELGVGSWELGVGSPQLGGRSWELGVERQITTKQDFHLIAKLKIYFLYSFLCILCTIFNIRFYKNYSLLYFPNLKLNECSKTMKFVSL